MKRTSRWMRVRRTLLPLAPYALFTAAACAIWLPQGFNIGSYYPEGWMLLSAHQDLGAVFDSMWPRLFRDIPVWLGIHLTPHGFQGWQAMLLLLMIARGALLYRIVRWLVPEQGSFALCCGLLAMLHPADSGYFLLNTTGLQFSLALTLGSCFCTCLYLDSRSKHSLTGMWVLQLMAGFTYSGFVPLMLAIPAGAWLVRRVEGKRPDPWFLAKAGILPVALAVFGVVMVRLGIGRDADVADVNLHGMLSGYWNAACRLIAALPEVWHGLQPGYLVPLLGVLMLAAWVAWRDPGDGAAPPTAPPARFWVILAGFVALAALCYLPYSITSIRYADRRQLLGAGIFGYAAMLFVGFSLLSRLPRYRILSAVIVLAVAATVTAAGLEKRDDAAQRYRSLESLLAAVAALAPHPPAHSVIVVRLSDPSQIDAIKDAYRHLSEFSYALQYMYGDRSLKGGFYGFSYTSARIGESGMQVSANTMKLLKPRPAAVAEAQERHYLAHHRMRSVPYNRLILVDYPLQGQPSLLGPDWVRSQASSKSVADAIRYDMPDTGVRPSRRAIMCSMLETALRPGYCGGGR